MLRTILFATMLASVWLPATAGDFGTSKAGYCGEGAASNCTPVPNNVVKTSYVSLEDLANGRSHETAVTCTSSDGSSSCECATKCVSSTSNCRCED